MTRRKFDRIKPETLDQVARDTGLDAETIVAMLKGKEAMTYAVTEALIDRDSDLHWGDFQR